MSFLGVNLRKIRHFAVAVVVGFVVVVVFGLAVLSVSLLLRGNCRVTL